MTKKKISDADAAYEEINGALLAGRLRPGMPLRERLLAEIFGLTRGAVRKVLLRLGTEGKVEMIQNRGAFVLQPSREHVQDIYDARRAVEAGMAALLSGRITPDQIAYLRAHIAQHNESVGVSRGDNVLLSGDFHGEMVSMIGSPVLEGVISNLVARTQVLVALLEPERHSKCAPQEHEVIVDALEDGDSDRAFKAMLWHLDQVESRILEQLEHQGGDDIEALLRSTFSKVSS